MEKQVRIKEDALKRLKKEMEEYAREIEEIQGEKAKAKETGTDESLYMVKHIEERQQEAERALESVQRIFRRTEEELLQIRKI